MPLQHYQPLIPESKLGIWHVTENNADLSALLQLAGRDDLLPLPAFRHDRRNSEWLAVRSAVIKMLSHSADINYDVNGKPHLTGFKGHISISHAWPYVCVFYHPLKHTGVDIERMDERIFRVAKKFIGIEDQWLDHPYDIRQLYLLWAAKEATFKMLGGGGIDFKEHLSMMPVKTSAKGEAIVFFKKNERAEKFTIYYEYLDSMILVYTIANNGQG